MKEAEFWEVAGERIRCTLCPHHCLIREGEAGLCGVRRVRNGSLISTVYGRPVALHVDPIEKKPLFHFHPGSLSLSMATVGCNLHCTFCQNWSISQASQGDESATGSEVSPKQLVDEALKRGCRTIAYTYSEPTIFYEYARDTARIAAKEGIDNLFVTNGFIDSRPLLALDGILHAANVDLKAFRDETYRHVMGGRLQPVLDTLIAIKQTMKIWVEVTTLVIPTINDSPGELRDIALFIHDELGPETPWHVSRFHPDYDLSHLPPTPYATLQRARETGLEEGLWFVYTGNLPGDPGETTYCPSCHHPIISRMGFTLTQMGIHNAKCDFCGAVVPGVWE